MIERVATGHELAAADAQIESGDRSAATLLTRASARLQLDDVEGALADFTAALQSAPGDAHAYGNRGIACAQGGTARGAGRARGGDRRLASGDRGRHAALTIDLGFAGALNNRGVGHLERDRLLSELGRVVEAAAARAAAGRDLDAAIERAPRSLLAYQNRAAAAPRGNRAIACRSRRRGARRSARARADLDQVLGLKPGDASALLDRALVADLAADCHVLAQHNTRRRRRRVRSPAMTWTTRFAAHRPMRARLACAACTACA
ncbi:MAG: hypothetical protein U1E76_11470 [Planctomycetota bacterium]